MMGVQSLWRTSQAHGRLRCVALLACVDNAHTRGQEEARACTVLMPACTAMLTTLGTGTCGFATES